MSEEIFNLRTKISMDTVDFESGSQAVQREMKKLKSETKLVDADLKLYGRTSEGLGEKLKTLSKLENGHVIQVKEARAEYEKYRKEYELNGNTLDNNSKKMDAAINKETQAKAALAKTRAEMGLLNTEILRNDSHLIKWGSSLTASGNKLNSFGKSMDGVANTWLRVSGVTLAATAGLVGSAVQWESSVASMVKTIDATPEDFEALTGSIRDLALEIPMSAASLAELAATAGQLGIETPKIAEFTETVAAMGVSSNLSATEAANSFARLANITGMSQDDFDKLGSSVIELGNNFATTESEISDMALRLAGAGTTVGLTEPDILGLATALSSLGIEAESGGSSMSKLMVEMQLATSQGGDYLQQFADVAGISAEEFSTAFTTDPISAIIKFTEGLGKIDAAGGSSIETLDNMGISEIRMRDALLRLANGSDILTDAVNTSNTAWEENTALQEEADKRYATTQSQLLLLKNKLMEVAISAGEELLPAVNDLVDDFEPLIENLSDAVKWFASLDDSTKEAALQFAGFVIVGAPVLKTLAGITKAAGTLTSGIGGVVGGLGELIVKHKSAASTAVELTDDIIGASGALGGMTGSASAAGGAAALFTNPWVLGIGAVALAAVGIGTLIYNEMTKDQKNHELAIEETEGKYQEWFDTVTEGAKGVVSSQEQIQGATKATASTYGETVERLKKQNTEVVEAAKREWEGYTDWSGHNAENMYSSVAVQVDGVGEKLKELKLSDGQISDIEDSYMNYRVIVGNTMTEVLNTFAEGKVMTADLASATISSNNAVTEEIVAGLTAQRDAEATRIDEMLVNNVITEETYNQLRQENGMHYAMMIQITQNANAEINEIVATAARENRTLTAEETIAMIDSYTTLASNSGKSMSDIAEAQDALGQNMRDMVSNVAIDALVQAGAISASAGEQIKSLDSVEGKVDALKGALDEYNQTGVPPKSIVVSSNASEVARSTTTTLQNIPDEDVIIKVKQEIAEATKYTNALGLYNGTNFHKGGLAVLGDGGKREPYLTPDGTFGVSPAVDTMYNLPRGSKVWSSIQKFKSQASNNDYLKSFMDQLPKFATGTQNSFLDSPKMPNVFAQSQSVSQPIVNVYQTINSPDPIDARESARLSKINMQNLGYMLSRG